MLLVKILKHIWFYWMTYYIVTKSTDLTATASSSIMIIYRNTLFKIYIQWIWTMIIRWQFGKQNTKINIFLVWDILSHNQINRTERGEDISICGMVHCVYGVTKSTIQYYLFQESYAMLQEFGVTIPKEENDKVDTMRYSFQKLMVMSVSYLVYYSVLSPTKWFMQLNAIGLTNKFYFIETILKDLFVFFNFCLSSIQCAWSKTNKRTVVFFLWTYNHHLTRCASRIRHKTTWYAYSLASRRSCSSLLKCLLMMLETTPPTMTL